MNASNFDAIVLGAGGVGTAAMLHLASRGARVLGIDRFEPGHDRGSSHGQTRIIRQAYFEHPDYVPMLLRCYELWHDLEDRCGQQLLFPVGLVQVGPPDGEVISGVRKSAEMHSLEVETWSAADLAEKLPGFYVPKGMDAVFERTAGYLLVEQCVIAHAQQAVRLGAQLHTSETVNAWRIDGGRVLVDTDRARYTADRLIITAGAWSGQLLGDLGISLTVLRKALYWWRPESNVYRADQGCPTFLYDLPQGCFYGFPQIDASGVKVAEHTGGSMVRDPLAVDRELDLADQARVGQFVSEYLPAASLDCTRHVVCMYTMTPDGHFVIDHHPRHPQVAFAAGLSGHGFKFTPVLGEALCELALDGKTRLPMSFLACDRPALQTTT